MNTVVAVYSDWGIGFGGTQPIVIPEDRQYFRKLTEGGIVIIGRKTFEGMGRLLPNRKNIILTRDRSFRPDGMTTAHSIDEVLAEVAADDPDRVFVIGGGDVFRQFLPFCAYAYVTKIVATPASDTFFPNLDRLSEWSLERIAPSGDCLLPSSDVSRPRLESATDIQKSNVPDYSFTLYKNNSQKEPNHV